MPSSALRSPPLDFSLLDSRPVRSSTLASPALLDSPLLDSPPLSSSIHFPPTLFPPLLRAFVRAYLLGHATHTLPRLAHLLLAHLVALRRRRSRLAELPTAVLRLLSRAFAFNGPAVASAVALGGARLVERRARSLVERIVRRSRPWRSHLGRPWPRTPSSDACAQELSDGELGFTNGLATFCSASLSSLVAISLLQTTGLPRPRHRTHSALDPTPTPGPSTTDAAHVFRPWPQRPSPLPLPQPSGHSATLDFTLFFTVRALDTLGRAVFDSYAPPCLWFLRGCSETIVFQVCCWRIMWCWFYAPDRLPGTYVKWITALAAMDPRLVQVIRLGRRGEYVYGVKPPSEDIRKLGRCIATCMGRPAEEGDPELISKLSCGIVHGKVGASENCTVNALRRWAKAWKQGMGIYLPVFAVPALLFHREKLLGSPVRTIARILLSSSRSACFLSSFVAMTWAGVCMGRSSKMKNILQLVKHPGALSEVYMDSTVGPQLGSFLAGFSILTEHRKRRGEMALYVAMRALCASMDHILPRWLTRRIERDRWASIWVERTVFAISIGTITSAVVHHPDYVRGVVKGIIKFAIGPDWPRKTKTKTKSEYEESHVPKSLALDVVPSASPPPSPTGL